MLQQMTMMADNSFCFSPEANSSGCWTDSVISALSTLVTIGLDRAAERSLGAIGGRCVTMVMMMMPLM